MADEMKQLEGASKALSKKEKRLMKQQLQKQSAKKKEESDESEQDNEDDQMEEDAQVEKEDEDDDDEEEEAMDEESKDGGEGDPLKDIKAFKKIVVTALIDNQMDQKRASKMEIIDFLNLLKIFNEKGIHFK